MMTSSLGDTEVVFADYTNKVNKAGKSQKRGIVVTEKNIYKHVSFHWNFADLRLIIRRTPRTTRWRNLERRSSNAARSGMLTTKLLRKITIAHLNLRHRSLSKQKDTFVVVHAKSPQYRDLVLDLGLEYPEKYSEFVTVLVQEYKKLTGEVIPVEFTDK